MAEKKTRILLRSDLLANWQSANPVLLKGELGVEFDPINNKTKFKIGDAITHWNDLPYVADYDLEIASKVEKELVGENGTAFIFNENDGGGAKFVNNDGVESFVGVNDGSNGIAAQIYADKLIDGKWQGAKLDVTNQGIYYTVGDKSAAERDIEENELLVRKDLAIALLNYYTKAEVDELIAGIKKWSYKIVEVLPEQGEEYIIYLVPKGAGKSGYREYIWIAAESKYEEIGDTDIDLSEYRKSADQDIIDNEIKADISAEEARAKAEEAKKVNRELVGANGTSYIFNEADGGGSKFVDNAGAAAYVGTHDNIGGVAGVQIYADKDAAASESTIIDIIKTGAYYNKGVIKPGSQRDVEANEIAVKGDIDVAVAEKEDKFDILDGGSAEDWAD